MEKKKGILFVDFFKTICFVYSFRLLPEAHRKKAVELLFGEDDTLMYEWMTGKYTDQDIVRMVARHIDHPKVGFEYLWGIHVEEHRTIELVDGVLDRLQRLREYYHVVLMTVNTGAFSEHTVPALGLNQHFDFIWNSYTCRCHKVHRGGQPFKDMGIVYGIPMEQCILLDDTDQVCDVFESLGGTAHRITSEYTVHHALDVLEESLTAGTC